MNTPICPICQNHMVFDFDVVSSDEEDFWYCPNQNNHEEEE